MSNIHRYIYIYIYIYICIYIYLTYIKYTNLICVYIVKWLPQQFNKIAIFSGDENFHDLFSLQLSNIQHSIANHSHHALHYILMIYMFYNWNSHPSWIEMGTPDSTVTKLNFLFSLDNPYLLLPVFLTSVKGSRVHTVAQASVTSSTPWLSSSTICHPSEKKQNKTLLSPSS